jgi:hypothetical protein
LHLAKKYNKSNELEELLFKAQDDKKHQWFRYVKRP